ncbi:MAG TPA: 4-vinyl reductase [Caldimonas sp.]
MSADFRQRLTFDLASGELRDGDTRYLILREDSLMGLFRRLPEPARTDAFRAFAASVAEHGARSAARYREREGDAGDLLATIAATAAQLGWGVWRFSRAEPGELQLEVKNSPFAHGYGASPEAVCAPIAGMFSAVASIVFDAPVQATEDLCASAGGAVCRFSARLRKP